ncbi:MAG: condensation domain-containing protein, partial [Bacteroidota bacterium]
MQDLLKKLTKRKVRINLLDGRLDIQAPKGVMTKALLEEIKLHKSALIDFIESHQNNQDDAQWKIAKAPVQADYPLSSAQKRIWMLCQFAEARQAYNMPCILKMEGPLDVEALNQSFQVLIDRHEALRTQFVENQQGEVRQVILASEPSIFKLEQLDLRFKSTTEEELHSIIQREVNYDFDLTAGRLVRARLIRIADEQFIFCCTLHHIISDGWSTQVMTEELFALYAAFVKGRAHALPPLNIQYKDYTNFLQQYIDQGQMAASRSFWLEQFSGDIPVLAIPTYTTRPATRSYQGNTVRKKFSKQLLSALHEKARRQHITLFMALTALTKLLFYRYTGQSDLIVGTPVSGREHPELQQQIGCYVNALALRTQIDQEDHFDRLLSKVKTTILNAFQHQAYPFDELVAELNLKRDQSRAPLFDVVVSFNKPVGKTGGKTLANTIQLQNYDWGTATMSRFDMELVYEQTSEGLELILTYNTAIYTEVFVKALGEHLEVLLAAVLEKPKKVLHQLEYLSPTEKYRLLEEYNQRVAPFSEAQTIVDLFEARVPQLATQKAVVFQEQELTYEALNAQANQLAHYLRQTFRIQADDIIGIRLKRSEQLIVAILAVIKSGAAYLPMDVQFPEERIAYLQKDSACKTIIDEDHLQNFEAVKEQYRSDNPDKINKASD